MGIIIDFTKNLNDYSKISVDLANVDSLITIEKNVPFTGKYINK